MEENTVLCGANAYEQKYYFNPDFESLPQAIQDELHIMCVLFTEEIGGIFTVEFTPEGELEFRTEAIEADAMYDEIGGALRIKEEGGAVPFPGAVLQGVLSGRGCGRMKPLWIGNVKIEKPLALAPMAGVTDQPFRLLCREQGAGLVCTEMVSAKAILYKNKNTGMLMAIDEKERPAALQLFGCEPEVMAEAARQIEERNFDILDVNMGCPVPKVVNNGEGSALMKNPKLAGEIVKALVKAVKKPVTVKIRKGFDGEHVNAVEMAKILEDAGAAAIAVHG